MFVVLMFFVAHLIICLIVAVLTLPKLLLLMHCLNVPDKMIFSGNFYVALSALISLLFLVHNLHMCPQLSYSVQLKLAVRTLQLLSISSTCSSFSFSPTHFLFLFSKHHVIPVHILFSKEWVNLTPMASCHMCCHASLCGKPELAVKFWAYEDSFK